MNGRTAKRLRRETYGDLSLKNPRRYVLLESGAIRLHPADPRARYRRAKAGKPVTPLKGREILALPYLSKEDEQHERRAFRQALGIFNFRKRDSMSNEQRVGLFAALMGRFLHRRAAA